MGILILLKGPDDGGYSEVLMSVKFLVGEEAGCTLTSMPRWWVASDSIVKLHNKKVT